MNAAARTAGQLPNQERIDVAEENLAGLGLTPQARDIFE